jgi:hypothetical protein
MSRYLCLLLLSLSPCFAQDFGNASDGVCSFATGVQAKATWNCSEVIVTGNATFPGTDSVIIKSQGNVTIQVGASLSVSASGTTSGPGGSGAGQGLGAGGSGGNGNDIDLFGASGGGGAGGTFHHQFPGANGVAGQTGGGNSVGGTQGVANTTGYGSSYDFFNQLIGGSGGGAGGSGDNVGSIEPGGSGGAGGGALAIIAQGEIFIQGNITASGGNGQSPGGNTGGGGGGGSGGAIFLYSKSQVTVDGQVLSLGGSGGLGGTDTPSGGNGGAGGKGRIRIDSMSGKVDGSGSVDPTPYLVSTMSLPTYHSDIAFACVYKEGIDYHFAWLSMLIVMMISILIPKLFRR